MDENKMPDDKFILMGLADERSGHVAEVLKNKTAKKILDFLSEIREASEKDISDKLNMPINTVEYNLKKLLKSGLVDKTKNFFWSVKGKKIPMYKLARKHIIISPNKKPSLNYIKSILPVIFIAVILVTLAGLIMLQEQGVIEPEQNQLKKFSSQTELSNFIKERSGGGFFDGIFKGIIKGGVAETAVSTVAGASQEAAADFSQTNIQVEGVDEADIVKNDGKYIYVVSGKKVVIVDAYPAENMQVLSEIEFNNSVNEIFINNDRLIVFSYQKAYIYDVSDREDLELESEIEFDGNYIDSRMIDDYVYVISNKYANRNNPQPPIYGIDGIRKEVKATDVYYWDYPDTNYVFTSIMAIDVNDNEVNSKVYLTGGSRNIYVSQDNIYLTYTKYVDYNEYAEEMIEEVYLPILSDISNKVYQSALDQALNSDYDNQTKLESMQNLVLAYSETLEGDEKAEFDKKLMEALEDFETKIHKQMEKTVIHKINVDKEDIGYIGAGEVPGRVLNQFSMDEYDGYFRIATTTGNLWGGTSLNHLYILDEDLEIAGSVEDLAKGERIYSVRFLGERAYVVTFKKIDPLFVIDVSNPEEPEVLGYLKITGYSDYLHIYDENHVIGIGKETAGGNEDFSWYQGIKISLFDVSDVANPFEKAKIEIGDRGTDSEALRDHRAVLFDKDKNLLVIPIRLAEVDETRYEGGIPDSAYGEHVWQGAFVLDISLDGIEERGRISHAGNYIQRSLYMDDVLYTVSEQIIKANDLDSIEEINSIDLNNIDYDEDSDVIEIS